jgi:transposase
VAAGTHKPLSFSLSPGQANDSPAGRKLLAATPLPRRTRVVMDKGYSNVTVRRAVRDKQCVPVVPPKANTRAPWRYDKTLYRERNQIERLFHHLKSFRRIATRYDKLDTTFRSFVALGLAMLLLRIC